MANSIHLFLAFLLSKKYSFRSLILTLFLSLFLFSFGCILTFTYLRNYQSILSFSRTVTQKTLSCIQAKFETVALAAERSAIISSGFLADIPVLSFKETLIVPYLFSVLKNDANFSSIYLGFPSGSLIQVLNTNAYEDLHMLTDPLTRLPKEVSFALELFNRDTMPYTDTWFYFDKDLKQLFSEHVLSSSFDAKKSPWYLGAEQTKQVFWSDVYTFEPIEKKGISVSTPLLIDNQLKAVMGADLSLDLLAEFVAQQKIGKTGKAFLLNHQKGITIPSSFATVPLDLIEQIHKRFKNNQVENDFILDYQSVSYLSFVTALPDIFGGNWSLVAVAPLNEFMGSVIHSQKQIILFILLIITLSIVVIAYFCKRAATPIIKLSQEIQKIKEFDLTSKARVDSPIKEIFLLDQSISSMRSVIQSFSKYVPHEIVKKSLDTHHPITIEGEKKEITIFFSDVSNFTSIAESVPIDVLLPLLTEYFDAMSSIIQTQKGTIDKFIGDGIMALWGVPEDFADHTQKACDAALICHAMLQAFNAKRRSESKPEFLTRFGIHTGPIIVGNIGTEDRFNYTVIGDAVNTTARLQNVDKVYHTSIMISEEAYLKLGSEYIGRPLDLVAVKGKVNKTKIYELVGKLGPREDICPSLEQIDLCKRFTIAYNLLQENKLHPALTLFNQISCLYPNDFPTHLYLERIRKRL